MLEKLTNFINSSTKHDSIELGKTVNEIKKNVKDTRTEYHKLIRAFEEMKQLYQEKSRSERLFRALGEISLSLLQTNKDLNKQFDRICFLLGTSSESDRCYVFELDDSNTATLISEWCDTNFCTPTDTNGKKLKQIVYSDYDWFNMIIRKREIVSAHIDNIPDAKFKEILKKNQVKSVLISPIYTNGNCWGFLGLDSCRKERKWNNSEIQAINIIANMIGSTLRKNNILTLRENNKTHQQNRFQLYG
ncbi:MAG: GAF domain-containing protein [bacterium]